MKVLFADEVNPGLIECRGRRRIRSTIEQRQFSDGTTRAFDGQDLLPAIGRTLEDSYLPALNDEQAGTGIALGEDKLSFAVAARHCPFGEKLEFGLSQPVEDRDAAKNFQSV